MFLPCPLSPHVYPVSPHSRSKCKKPTLVRIPLTRVGFLQISEEKTWKTGRKVDKEVLDSLKKVRLGAINCNGLREGFLERK